MIPLQQELSLWIKNYDTLKVELQAAYRFKNKEAIDDISSRLIMTQRQISEVVSLLEKQGNRNADSPITLSVGSGVDITKNSTM